MLGRTDLFSGPQSRCSKEIVVGEMVSGIILKDLGRFALRGGGLLRKECVDFRGISNISACTNSSGCCRPNGIC